MTPQRSTRSAIRPMFGACILMLCVGGLLMTACGQTDNDTRSATAGLPDLGQALTAHDWVLDPADSSIDVVDGHVMTLQFTDDDHAVGSAGCNTYRATVHLSGDSGIRFDAPVMTKKACDKPVMVAEQAFAEALDAVRKADVHDRNRLVLTGGDARLAFGIADGTGTGSGTGTDETDADAASGLSGTWTITSYRRADAIVSPLEGTEVAITFGDDASAKVTTGCNTIGTTWARDGDTIRFTQGRRTLKACVDPPGVMDQEQALADALTATDRIETTGTTLRLLDANGDMVIVASRA